MTGRIDDLIARLEAATGDSAELLILAFTARFPAPAETWGDEWQGWYYRRSCFVRMLDARAYQSAALTLVPEGMRRRVVSLEDGRAGVQLCWPTDGWPDPFGPHYATEAIATCIAALRGTAP